MEQHSPTNPFRSLQGISLQHYPTLMSLDDSSNYDLMLKPYLPDSPDTSIFFDEDEENNIRRDLPSVTKSIHKFHDSKKKYSNISNALRMELLEAVENQGEKIKHVQTHLFDPLFTHFRLLEDLTSIILPQNPFVKFINAKDEVVKRPLKDEVLERNFPLKLTMAPDSSGRALA